MDCVSSLHNKSILAACRNDRRLGLRKAYFANRTFHQNSRTMTRSGTAAIDLQVRMSNENDLASLVSAIPCRIHLAGAEEILANTLCVACDPRLCLLLCCKESQSQEASFQVLWLARKRRPWLNLKETTEDASFARGLPMMNGHGIMFLAADFLQYVLSIQAKCHTLLAQSTRTPNMCKIKLDQSRAQSPMLYSRKTCSRRWVAFRPGPPRR